MSKNLPAPAPKGNAPQTPKQSGVLSFTKWLAGTLGQIYVGNFWLKFGGTLVAIALSILQAAFAHDGGIPWWVAILYAALTFALLVGGTLGINHLWSKWKAEQLSEGSTSDVGLLQGDTHNVISTKVETNPHTDVRPRISANPRNEIEQKIEANPNNEVKTNIEANPRNEFNPTLVFNAPFHQSQTQPQRQTEPPEPTKPKFNIECVRAGFVNAWLDQNGEVSLMPIVDGITCKAAVIELRRNPDDTSGAWIEIKARAELKAPNKMPVMIREARWVGNRDSSYSEFDVFDTAHIAIALLEEGRAYTYG